MELHGRVVPLAANDPQRHFRGRVRLGEDGAIDSVLRNRTPSSNGLRVVDVGDAFIYPGLIDLHSHIGFASLPLWDEPARDHPFLHHNTWPSAPSYRPFISWPAYALIKGAPEALLAYAQVRALAGGTTSIQGWPPANRRPANQLVRNIDDENFGNASDNSIRTSALTLSVSDLKQRARHIESGGGFIYHCAEGQGGSLAAREFAEAARAGCLRSRLIAIHCNAVGDADFRQWQEHATLAGDASPGSVVWSPFSNLWLYGETTDVAAARKHHVSVCLGTDWAPSGTKNLLGELKIANLWIREAGLDISHFDLVEMVTSSPGDVLGACWPHAAGRLEAGRLADITVVARRHPDPWKNLVMARESDVLLVIVGGHARYGTRDLMRACGESRTTSVGIGADRRHALLRKPDDAEQVWTWSSVLGELDEVRADPDAAIDRGHRVARAALEASLMNGAAPPPGLVLELDMPGAPEMFAGPPPPGVEYEVPEPSSLVHDRAWLGSLRERGFHNGVLDRVADYYV
ncbi:MAG: amidohydrolase family protein [Luteitalea sp.]|nr:amidohydrolase family protein [Luteitalea sp.]